MSQYATKASPPQEATANKITVRSIQNKSKKEVQSFEWIKCKYFYKNGNMSKQSSNNSKGKKKGKFQHRTLPKLQTQHNETAKSRENWAQNHWAGQRIIHFSSWAPSCLFHLSKIRLTSRVVNHSILALCLKILWVWDFPVGKIACKWNSLLRAIYVRSSPVF